jgi:hypothetical protein
MQKSVGHCGITHFHEAEPFVSMPVFYCSGFHLSDHPFDIRVPHFDREILHTAIGDAERESVCDRRARNRLALAVTRSQHSWSKLPAPLRADDGLRRVGWSGASLPSQEPTAMRPVKIECECQRPGCQNQACSCSVSRVSISPPIQSTALRQAIASTATDVLAESYVLRIGWLSALDRIDRAGGPCNRSRRPSGALSG